MTSAKLGKRTSEVEVTNVSSHGFWLLIGDKERFLAFEHFPWFLVSKARSNKPLQRTRKGARR